MTETLPIPVANASLKEQLIECTLATCVSPETSRAYAYRLRTFIASGYPINREGVAFHLRDLREAGAGSGVIGITVAAIRKFAKEAKVRRLLDIDTYNEIVDLKPGHHPSTRTGRWLTTAQVQQLLSLPDRTTYWGRRDAALLDLLVGCGLRRAEMAGLTWDHYQPREGRPCLVDLKGKGNRLRTVPVPTWAIADVEAWQEDCQQPPVFSPRHPRRKFDPSMMTGGIGYEALFKIVEKYARKMGLDFRPHDLRRTLAQMLRRAGAPLEQIQLTLGHASIATTQIYLGSDLELAPGAASVDKLAILPPPQRMEGHSHRMEGRREPVRADRPDPIPFPSKARTHAREEGA